MSEMPQNTELEFDLLDRLRKAMRISGKDAGDLAVDLGVHRNTIGNYLNGRTPIDRRTVVAWAVCTGVPLEWLETGQTTGPNGGPDGERDAALARLADKKRARHAGNRVNDPYAAAA